jgi:MFS family permease
MKLYIDLWNSRGLMPVVFAQLLARFPYGMMVLAVVMHVENSFNSYAIAGIALGADTVASAINGPIMGRLIGRFGIFKVVLPGALVAIAATLLMAFTPFAAWWVILLAAIIGFATPPIQTAARLVYPRLVKPELQSGIFALDATSQELIWILGPVIATFAAAQVSTVFALVLMAGIQAVGVALFLSNRDVLAVKPEQTKAKIGHVMKNRSVIVLVILGSALVASFSGLEIATVAVLDKTVAGIVIGIFSIGSILGGLLFGHRNKSKWALAVFFTFVFAGYTLAMINPSNPIWLSLCWLVGGLAVAPILGTVNNMISIATHDADTPEAYGWLNTGQLLGYAVAAVAVGFLIDQVAPAAGFWVAIGFSFIGLCVSLISVESLPKLPSAH